MRQTDITAEQIIEKLGMVPLADEGGMVLETYKSKTMTDDGKMAGSAIYYLLRGESFSHFHRLSSDEIWHFYLGDPVELTELLPDGSVKMSRLGNDITNGECLQHLIPAGNWQGARLAEGGEWALLGMSVCPGYDEKDYEHADRDTLLKQYPAAKEEIMSMTGTVKY